MLIDKRKHRLWWTNTTAYSTVAKMNEIYFLYFHVGIGAVLIN